MEKINLEALLAGVNPIYNSTSLSKNKNIIFYTCANSIILNDVEKAKNLFSLNHHTNRVNFIQNIANFTNRQLLLSGDVDAKLLIWECEEKFLTDKEKWHIKYQFELEHSVSFSSVCEFSENEAYIVAGNIMGDVFLIKITDEKHEILDRIKFGSHFTQETSAIIKLEEEKNQLLILFGGLDFTIHVYLCDLNMQNAQKGDYFQYRTSLKGHENAITDIKVWHQKENHQWIIATSSKDSYIRLWKLSKVANINLKEVQISEFQNKEIQKFQVQSQEYFTSLESVISGHNESVVSLDWGFYKGQKALLSASFDFNILIWVKDEDTGIWISTYRLGQISGSKYAFFNAKFSMDNQFIYSYTYTGSFYFWKFNNEKSLWESIPSVTGHFNEIYDLDWSHKGDFLGSCGLDQTTRIYCQSLENKSWHEVSRAQIHGYDINSLKFYPVQLSNKNICDTLICGADEKVVRLFEPPAAFVNAVNQMSKTDLHLYFDNDEQEKQYLDQKQLEKGIIEYQVTQEGGQQVLGLMTKAQKITQDFNPGQYIDPEDEVGLIADKIQQLEDQKLEIEFNKQKHDFSKPPIEDYLVKHTLWPELNKLYGHGYELKCVSCSHDGQLIASCSKSQTKQNACVIFWNPHNYQIYSKLEYHNFTINQMEFSSKDNFFATISKDRQIAVFRKNVDQNNKLILSNPYQLFYEDKSHSRIIFSLNFTSDEKYVATSGRDKRLKIHCLESKKVIFTKLFDFAATAVAFAPNNETLDFYYIVLGFENGAIDVYQFKPQNSQLELFGKVNQFYTHTDLVQRIKFRNGENQKNGLQFATCSNDHSVRIFSLNV